MKVPLHRWLDPGSNHQYNGSASVAAFAEKYWGKSDLSQCQWFPSQKSKVPYSTTHFPEHMATPRWLFMFLLHFSSSVHQQRSAAVKAKGILFSLVRWAMTMPDGNPVTASFQSSEGGVSISGPLAKLEWSGEEYDWAQALWDTSRTITTLNEDVRKLAGFLLRMCEQQLVTRIKAQKTATPLEVVGSVLRGPVRMRRLPRSLLAHAGQKKRPHSAMAAWKDDGSGLSMSAEVCMKKHCALYLNQTRKACEGAETVELLFDGSTYGETKSECIVIFTPGSSSGFAAFLPPLPHRELAWRQQPGVPGSKVSSEDYQRFLKQGFKKDPGLRAVELLSMLNHNLKIATGNDLSHFAAPGSFFRPMELQLQALPPHGARYFCDERQQWIREHEGVELPELDLTAGPPKILMLTLDQEMGVESDELPVRLMSLLWHTCAQRFWSYAHFQFTYPGMFAKLLLEDPRDYEELQHFWELVTDAESWATVLPGLHTLREQLYFLRFPLVQYTFRLLSHYKFRPCKDIKAFLARLFSRLGDTRLIEEGHKLVTDRQRDQAQQDVSSLRAMHSLTRHSPENPLCKRQIMTPVVEEEHWHGDKVCFQLPEEHNWNSLFRYENSAVKGFSMGKAGNRTFTSKSPAGAQQAIGASVAMVQLSHIKNLKKAGDVWQTCLLGPQSVFRHRPTDKYWFVIASSTYAARAAPLAPDAAHGGFHWSADLPWSWITVEDWKEWDFIPTRWGTFEKLPPADPQKTGFLKLHQTGGPVPSAVAALCQYRAHGTGQLLLWQRSELVATSGFRSRNQREREIGFLKHHVETADPGLPVWQSDLEKVISKMEAAAARRREKRATGECDQESSSDEETNDIPLPVLQMTVAAIQELPTEEAQQCSKKELNYRKRSQATTWHENMSRIAAETSDIATKQPDDVQMVPVRPDGNEAEETQSSSKQQKVQQPPAATATSGRIDSELWVRGHKGSIIETLLPWFGETRPSSVVSLRMDSVPSKSQWSARFESSSHGKKDSKTKSKGYVSTRATSKGLAKTEHLAFQVVLEWIWTRAEQWFKLEKPGSVREALAACTECGNGKPCAWMTKLHSRPVAQQTQSTTTSATVAATTTKTTPITPTSTPPPSLSPPPLPTTSSSSTAVPSTGGASSATNQSDTPKSFQTVPHTSFSFHGIIGDGNCLFAAYACGKALVRNKLTLEQLKVKDTQSRLAGVCRCKFLNGLKAHRASLSAPDRVELDELVETASGKSFVDYLQGLSDSFSGMGYWAGQLEVVLMGRLFPNPCTCAILKDDKFSKGNYAILDVVGRVGPPPFFLLWNGKGHYDLLIAKPGASQDIMKVLKDSKADH
mmetsp:Transcript_52539/g.114719  ORF Transcript_52539/g.114719 Transcript_52539/m.114719 type:complete len:1337 (-) Transcript_52539:10-4020(-)